MRTIRDEDRDARRDEPTVTIEGVSATRGSAKAVLCVIEGREIWIPKSQIHDDSEVYDAGHEGRLVITRWIAEQKDLA